MIELKDIAEFGGTIVTGIGVLVANKGLNTWRNQKIGIRKIEVAEDIIASFVKFHDQIVFIGNEHVSIDQMKIENLPNIHLSDKYLLIRRAEIRRNRAQSCLEEMTNFFDKKHIAFVYFGPNIIDHFHKARELYTKQYGLWNAISTHDHIEMSDRQFEVALDYEKNNVTSFDKETQCNARLERILRDFTKDIHEEIMGKNDVMHWKEWIWPSI